MRCPERGGGRPSRARLTKGEDNRRDGCRQGGGQGADFIIVDRDPLLASPSELRATKVEQTWVRRQMKDGGWTVLTSWPLVWLMGRDPKLYLFATWLVLSMD